MEQSTIHLFTNKRIQKTFGLLLVILSLFFFVKFLQGIKDYSYSSRAIGETSQISISGEGEAFAVPDVAEINFTISKEAKTVKEAQEYVNTKTTEAVEFLKSKGVEEKDIKTTSDSFYPQYDYPQVQCFTYPCPSQKPVIRGYEASRSFSVKVRNADDAGTVSQGLGDKGVTNLSGPNFIVDNDTEIQNEARGKAIADAETKAKILAKQLGVRLVRVVNFSENGNGAIPPMYYARDMKLEAAGLGGATPVELPKGENKYSSYVTITYEIR